MTLSSDLKLRVLKKIKERKYSIKEIMDLYDISKSTFYKIKYEYSKNQHNKTKRNTKITPRIKSYIVRYVTRKINFVCEKLISRINQKFGIEINQRFTMFSKIKK
jgi:transposase